MSKSNHTEAQMIGALNNRKRDVRWKTWRGKWGVKAHDLRLEGEVRREWM